MDRRLSPKYFDFDRPLVSRKFLTIQGADAEAGTILTGPDAKLDPPLERGLAMRIWLSGQAVYATEFRPTPQETPQEEAERVVTMEATGGGWYLILAPWLGEGEKIRGKEAAEARYAEIVATGDTKGVTIEGPDGGGWYTITAPWLDEPTRIQGNDAAMVELAELRATGAPEGWHPETEEERAAREEAKQKAEADALARIEADAAEKRAAEEAEAAAAEKAKADAEAKAAEEEAQRAAAEATAQAAVPGATASAEAPPADGSDPARTETGEVAKDLDPAETEDGKGE
jgi:hypothetical protein